MANTVNAGQLHEYAANEEAFNRLLIENPGLRIEQNVFFFRNLNKLVKSAVGVDNTDFLYWIKDHDLTGKDSISVAQTLLTASANLSSPQQALYLQEDVLKSFGSQLEQDDNFNVISWGLMRTAFFSDQANASAVNLKQSLLRFLHGAVNDDTILSIANESIEQETAMLVDGDIERLLSLSSEDATQDLKEQLFAAFAKANKLEQAKELIDLGADPFSNDNNLNDIIPDPTEEQRNTISTLENYKFSLGTDVNEPATSQRENVGSFVI